MKKYLRPVQLVSVLLALLITISFPASISAFTITCQQQSSDISQGNCQQKQKKLRSLHRQLDEKRTALQEVGEGIEKQRRHMKQIRRVISEIEYTTEEGAQEIAACLINTYVPVAGPSLAAEMRQNQNTLGEYIANAFAGIKAKGESFSVKRISRAIMKEIDPDKMDEFAKKAGMVFDLAMLNKCIWSYTIEKYMGYTFNKSAWEEDREITTELINAQLDSYDKYKKEVESLKEEIANVEEQVENCSFNPKVNYPNIGSDPGVVAVDQPQVNVNQNELSLKENLGHRKFKVPPEGKHPFGGNDFNQDTLVSYRWGQEQGYDPIVIEGRNQFISLEELAEMGGFDPEGETTRKVIKEVVEESNEPYPDQTIKRIMNNEDHLSYEMIRELSRAFKFDTYINLDPKDPSDLPPPTKPMGGTGNFHVGDHTTFSMTLRIPLFYPAIPAGMSQPYLTRHSDLWAKNPNWVPILGRKDLNRASYTPNPSCEDLGEGKWNINQSAIVDQINAATESEDPEKAFNCLSERERLSAPPALRGERQITVGLRAYTENGRKDIRGSFVRIKPRDRSARWITLTYKTDLVFTKPKSKVKIVPTLWGLEGKKNRTPRDSQPYTPLTREKERTFEVKEPYTNAEIIKIQDGQPHPGPGEAGLRVNVRSEAYPTHNHDPSGTSLDGKTPSGMLSPVESPEGQSQVGLVKKLKKHGGCKNHPNPGTITFTNNKIQMAVILPPRADKNKWKFSRDMGSLNLTDQPKGPKCGPNEVFNSKKCKCVEKGGTDTGNGDGDKLIGLPFTPNVEVGFASLGGDDFQNVSGGFGFEAGGHFPLSNDQLTLGGGLSFSTLSLDGFQSTGNLNMLGLFAEPRYRPRIEGLDLGPITPFVGAQVALSRQKRSLESTSRQQSFEQNLTGWGVRLEGRTGIEYPLNKNIRLDMKLGLGFVSYGKLEGTFTQSGQSQDIDAPSSSGSFFTIKVGVSLR